MDGIAVRKIEDLVAERRAEAASHAIRRLVRRRDFDEATVLRSLEWYRRLGLYRQGYRLAVRLLQDEDRFDSSRIGGKLALWIARYLYLLGATRLSVDLINRIQLQGLRDARDHHFVGEAFLAIGEYEQALKNYSRAQELETEPHSRAARICRLGLADSLAGLGRLDEALLRVRKERPLTDERVALAVILSCEGEYLARQEKFSEALPVLRAAEKFLPEADQTVDRALCWKWLGFSLARLGEMDQGLALLAQARDLLERSGIRKEAVFDVLWLERQLRPLPSGIAARITQYPGVDAAMVEKWEGRVPLRLGEPESAYANGAVIDFGSEEFHFQGTWNLGLPLEIRLLGALAIAGEWGLSSMRAIDFLWPDQPLALLQLENRLEQMLRRLAKVYRFEVESREGLLFLRETDRQRLAVVQGVRKKPRLLLENPEPSATEVMSFYSLKKSAAYAVLKNWKVSEISRNNCSA